MLLDLPIWGQLSIMALSLGLNITFILMYVRGELASRREVEQIQKTADTFQAAWATAQADNSEQKSMIVDIADGMRTVTKFINALPPASDRDTR